MQGMDIKNKVIIITGASQGIGEATAKYLGKMGAKLVLAARSAEKIQKLAKELPDAFAVPTDMRQAEEVKKLVDETLKKYGRVDILINNAGQGMYGPAESIDIEEYKKIMELNVYGYLRAMQAVIPVMKKQAHSAGSTGSPQAGSGSASGGMILNISSRVSKNYFPALAAYASTKYAVNALSLTARQELAKDNITVSVFHPKMTSTEFNKHSLGSSPYWEARPGAAAPVVDTPEQVAEKIAGLIDSELPEESM